MINIILNKKIINFYKIIKEAILGNGFAKYIIETIAPTFKFLSFILKNINKIYFFIIKKINIKNFLPYSIIIFLVFLLPLFQKYLNPLQVRK